MLQAWMLITLGLFFSQYSVAGVHEVGLSQKSVDSLRNVIEKYSYKESQSQSQSQSQIEKDTNTKNVPAATKTHKVSSQRSAPQSYAPPKKTVRTKKPIYRSVDQPPKFDLPVTYNPKVKKWIKYYQTNGKQWFRSRLERSARYLPLMKDFLKERGLPTDLAYIAMIESGFSAKAISSANAVGYWQFIKPTANRYGLQTKWWIDERRDFKKSTLAAAAYLGDLYGMFRSWYLTAAAYNMGEGRTGRLIRRHKTSNFWELSRKKGFPKETREYIPKLIACMLIAKTPALYGFYDLKPWQPHDYEYFTVPGGTDLHNIAKFLNVSTKSLDRLNPELIRSFIPKYIPYHRIRIPRGYTQKMAQYIKIRSQLARRDDS